jgi:ABC-2 type transport system permease protein
MFFLSFAEGLRLAAGTLVQHRREIIQTGIPKMVLLMVNTLHSLGDTICRATALVLVMVCLQVKPSPLIALAPVFLLALTAFGFGLGSVLSLIAVYYRDMLNILSAALSYLFFASGTFIRIPAFSHDSHFLDILYKILRSQPIYIIVDQSRQLCLGGAAYADEPWALVAAVIFCFAIVPIGLTLYYRGESLVNSHL